MPSTVEPITFSEFQAHPYPYDTLDLDQIVSYRIRARKPIEGTSMPPCSPSKTPTNPSPSDTSTQEPIDLSPTLSHTKPPRKLWTSIKCLSRSVFKTLKSCKILRSCFPVSELGDLDSTTARMLHAHWEDLPPSRQHWTYEAAERKPRGMWMPRARRRFADDTTGRPIWVLEAEAVEQGRL
ncbi:hypothetical protein J1614_009368 [Plenodomus biglobosus]|nr:hypothetical protein J1614_009368 [Plenodomus biglobosus]